MRFLQGHGYRVIPVNPGLAGQTLHGERVHASLAAMLPRGRSTWWMSSATPATPARVADQAVAIGAKVVWMQLGVEDEAAAARAEQAGLKVIMDRCPADRDSPPARLVSWRNRKAPGRICGSTCAGRRSRTSWRRKVQALAEQSDRFVHNGGGGSCRPPAGDDDLNDHEAIGSVRCVVGEAGVYQKVIPVDLEKAVKAVGSLIAGGHLGFQHCLR